MSRKYTQHILDNIVDDFGQFKEYKLYALLKYLVCNASLLEVDIKVTDYLKEYRLSDIESNNDIIDKSNKLYETLSTIISGMM